eukprot:1157243-Pelagomonas_calceolata.AAC.3
MLQNAASAIGCAPSVPFRFLRVMSCDGDVQRLVLGMAEHNSVEGRNDAAGWKPQQQQQQLQQPAPPSRLQQHKEQQGGQPNRRRKKDASRI